MPPRSSLSLVVCPPAEFPPLLLWHSPVTRPAFPCSVATRSPVAVARLVVPLGSLPAFCLSCPCHPPSSVRLRRYDSVPIQLAAAFYCRCLLYHDIYLEVGSCYWAVACAV
eukprot:6197685-Pleurochrysis_carterae.AAC.2